jgi:hypothetical protein
MYTQYGPGDPETWGPCTGHPMDPRTDPPDEEQQTADANLLIDEAMLKGDIGQMLRDAGVIGDADWEALGEADDYPTQQALLDRYDPTREKLREWLIDITEQV